ncbi:MAG: ribose 5-phosphate isomerase B [Candidatus Aminicenantes bacterium RBG_13_62_12]|nr:MAG: ribose 5-phosphate isomerase B [Candidatus Aminicenantes bacterium RBG_13_62_12]
MKIALASDHAGYALKKDIIALLVELGYEPVDFGCGPEEKANYVLFAEKAARAVQEGSCALAITFCGTGLGMALVANKLKGVRATPCWDEYTARMSRSHNNANVLALGGRVTLPDKARAIVRVWLETEFEGGRHRERLDTLREVEERACRPSADSQGV